MEGAQNDRPVGEGPVLSNNGHQNAVFDPQGIRYINTTRQTGGQYPICEHCSLEIESDYECPCCLLHVREGEVIISHHQHSNQDGFHHVTDNHDPDRELNTHVDGFLLQEEYPTTTIPPAVIGCGKSFHAECLHQWISQPDRSYCPNCRAHIRQPIDDDTVAVEMRKDAAFGRVQEERRRLRSADIDSFETGTLVSDFLIVYGIQVPLPQSPQDIAIFLAKVNTRLATQTPWEQYRWLLEDWCIYFHTLQGLGEFRELIQQQRQQNPAVPQTINNGEIGEIRTQFNIFINYAWFRYGAVINQLSYIRLKRRLRHGQPPVADAFPRDGVQMIQGDWYSFIEPRDVDQGLAGERDPRQSALSQLPQYTMIQTMGEYCRWRYTQSAQDTPLPPALAAQSRIINQWLRQSANFWPGLGRSLGMRWKQPYRGSGRYLIQIFQNLIRLCQTYQERDLVVLFIGIFLLGDGKTMINYLPSRMYFSQANTSEDHSDDIHYEIVRHMALKWFIVRFTCTFNIPAVPQDFQTSIQDDEYLDHGPDSPETQLWTVPNIVMSVVSWIPEDPYTMRDIFWAKSRGESKRLRGIVKKQMKWLASNTQSVSQNEDRLAE